MKAKTTIPSLGALAVATLLSASPAQACMGGGMPFFSSGPGQASCATGQVQAQTRHQACPQGGEAGGQQACGLINPELMAAMGDMAAGGMQIATHMMRVLAEEVSRYAVLGDSSR
ncbi:MAG: hypothetical protein H6935_04730 [Thiobacillus sp.]|nr:hypothetical protein [Thiobacillus sp.]